MGSVRRICLKVTGSDMQGAVCKDQRKASGKKKGQPPVDSHQENRTLILQVYGNEFGQYPDEPGIMCPLECPEGNTVLCSSFPSSPLRR